MNRSCLRHALPALLALCTVAAAPTTAAELTLTGPDGADVTLNGEPVGTLPLFEPLDLAIGEYMLAATLPGAHDIVRDLTIVDEGEILELHLRFTPMSRTTAMVSSIILAGSGQRQIGRDRLGWILTGAEMAGLLTALAGELQISNHESDYLRAMESYDNAVTPEAIAHWRAQADHHHDSMTSAADRRDLALMVAAGAVLVSVADAWLSFPSLDADVAPDGSARLGLSLDF